MATLRRWRSALIGIGLTIACLWYYGPLLWPIAGVYAIPCICFVAGYTVNLLVMWGAYTLGAHRCRYQFHLAYIGPIQIARVMGGVRVRRHHERPHIEVVTLPTDTHDLRRRTMRLFWVSPLASLALTLGAMILLALITLTAYPVIGLFPFSANVDPLYASRRSGVGLLIGIAGPVVLYLGVVAASAGSFGLLHFIGAFVHGGNAQSSRDQWQILKADGPSAKQHLARLALGGMSWSGVRPREWDDALVARAIGPVEGETHLPLDGALSAYWHALDRGDDEDIARLIADLRDRLDSPLPEAYALTIRCEAAFYAAWFMGDAEAARSLLPEARTMKRERQRLARAEAAVFLAEGRSREAWTRATEGIALLDTANNLGVAYLDGDLLNAIMARAMGVTPQSVPLPPERAPFPRTT